MMNARSSFVVVFCIIAIYTGFLFSRDYSYAGTSISETMMPGIPLGGSESDPDYDLCPEGIRVIDMFLTAWKDRDYAGMYKMIDAESKKKYAEEDTIFNFKFLEYKPYKVSSIRSSGDDFEFILSYGSWDTADKDVIKMLLDGRTFKIIMPERGSPFKRSAGMYYRR